MEFRDNRNFFFQINKFKKNGKILSNFLWFFLTSHFLVQKIFKKSFNSLKMPSVEKYLALQIIIKRFDVHPSINTITWCWTKVFDFAKNILHQNQTIILCLEYRSEYINHYYRTMSNKSVKFCQKYQSLPWNNIHTALRSDDDVHFSLISLEWSWNSFICVSLMNHSGSSRTPEPFVFILNMECLEGWNERKMRNQISSGV